jgi:hypothetical protein
MGDKRGPDANGGSLKEQLATILHVAEQAEQLGPAQQSSAYYRCKHLLQSVRDKSDPDAGYDVGYLFEKLTHAEVHLAALLGLEDNGGHSLDQHHVWLIGAVKAAARELDVELD